MISIKFPYYFSGTLILGLFLLTGIHTSGQVVRSQVTEWTEILDASSLSTPNEAGSDLNPTLETIANYNQLDINNVKNTQNWRVTVSKLDINWTPLFVPYIQRTSIGVPCGSCTGVNVGTSVMGYMPITDLEQDFIYGTGKVNDIDLQFRIEGITLAVKADYYRTTVVFTLYGD